VARRFQPRVRPPATAGNAQAQVNFVHLHQPERPQGTTPSVKLNDMLDILQSTHTQCVRKRLIPEPKLAPHFLERELGQRTLAKFGSLDSLVRCVLGMSHVVA
jgi:hypothetical protein